MEAPLLVSVVPTSGNKQYGLTDVRCGCFCLGF